MCWLEDATLFMHLGDIAPAQHHHGSGHKAASAGAWNRKRYKSSLMVCPDFAAQVNGSCIILAPLSDFEYFVHPDITKISV
jgi:hypothetical protein